MQLHPWSRWISALVLATWLGGPLLMRAQDTPPPMPSSEAPVLASDDEEQDAALTSGPVHEAFAAPITLQAQAGLLAPSAPPDPVTETPPDSRPAGKGYLWIPGYWAWDDGRQTYLWVSACWRLAPPNMYWVPGYWSQAANGWEWEPGFWAPTTAQELEYLPTPPDAGDLLPTSPPPSEDSNWVPPCHYWQRDHYLLRPGYWLAEQPGWMWIPSHYVRTPHGYVFSEGHWDYALERRGVLFAPMNFTRALLGRTRFGFMPNIVVDLGILSSHLFVHARYCHYYFGDYYDAAYVKIGIYPSFQSERLQTWYDPLFVYQRWQNVHTTPHWEDHERQLYAARSADSSLRPAHTYREQQTRLATHPADARHGGQPMARPLVVVVAAKNTTLDFTSVSPAARERYVQKAGQVHQWGDDRRQWETGPDSHPATAGHPEEHAAPRTNPADHGAAPAAHPQPAGLNPPHVEPAAPVAVEHGTHGGGDSHKPPAATVLPTPVAPTPPPVTPVAPAPVAPVPSVVNHGNRGGDDSHKPPATPVVPAPVAPTPAPVTPVAPAPVVPVPPVVNHGNRGGDDSHKPPAATVVPTPVAPAPAPVTPPPAAAVPAPAAPVVDTPAKGHTMHSGAFTPPAEVPIALPTRVKVAAPPIVGAQEDAGASTSARSLPGRPAAERKYRDRTDATDPSADDKHRDN